MSDPLRIALVAEGPTDGVVIESALRSMLDERPFVLKQVFPEGSISFGELGGGWIGVFAGVINQQGAAEECCPTTDWFSKILTC